MVRIIACKYNENKKDILFDKMSLLRLSDYERVNRYKFEKDRALSLLGTAVVYNFADKFTSLTDEITVLDNYDFITKDGDSFEFEIEVSKEGKPFIKGNEVFFSVSHSDDLCMVALSHKEIGFDVQHLRKLKCDVAGRFFHPKDNEYLTDITGDRNSEVARMWAVKESFVKLDGRGIGYGMGNFYVDYGNECVRDNEGKVLAGFKAFVFEKEYFCAFSQY